MQKNLDKYFWDGAFHISEESKLQRILEYASFPDLITCPIEYLKKYLPAINTESLRTSQKRKEFIKLITPLLSNSKTWEDVIGELIRLSKE